MGISSIVIIKQRYKRNNIAVSSYHQSILFMPPVPLRIASLHSSPYVRGTIQRLGLTAILSPIKEPRNSFKAYSSACCYACCLSYLLQHIQN